MIINHFTNGQLIIGYKENLTIDRIDNNKGYFPNNCRWVTLTKQANNRTNNHLVTLNGETKTLMEWCLFYSINYKTVRDRLKRGWSYQEALRTSVDGRFRRKVV